MIAFGLKIKHEHDEIEVRSLHEFTKTKNSLLTQEDFLGEEHAYVLQADHDKKPW